MICSYLNLLPDMGWGEILNGERYLTCCVTRRRGKDTAGTYGQS